MTYYSSTEMKVRVGLVVSILVFCCLPFMALTLGKWVDEAICVPAAASRVGEERTYDGLYHYLRTHLMPGMTREEVKQAVEKLGPVAIEQDNSPAAGVMADTIVLDICFHPLNDIRFFAQYDLDGNLIAIKTLSD